jgi:diacylglycerol kinase family enzyme
VIVVVVNPQSRANRRNPKLAETFRSIVGEVGAVIAPPSLEDLDATAAELSAKPPTLIAVHGGDGTVHKTLTALIRAFGERPLPPLALLCGGTMNVIPTALKVRDRPLRFLRYLVESLRGGRRLQTLRRRCIRVGDQYGFIFGSGFIANFLTAYYADRHYGPKRAVWILFRILLSAVVLGPFARRIFKRFRGRVCVDGGPPLSFPSFVAIGAATVREVGLGFKLNHRADDDPERFGVLAIHKGPLALVPDFVPVHLGKGVAPSRAWSAVASRMEIEPDPRDDEGRIFYTIDGDLYRSSGAIQITVGPTVELVKPEERSLIKVKRRDTLEAGQ